MASTPTAHRIYRYNLWEIEMGLTGILADQPELKMAYTEKKAESVITGLEKPINDYLLMVWAMPESEHRAHWLNELANWIDEVGEIILKPKNRRPMADFYYRILSTSRLAAPSWRT